MLEAEMRLLTDHEKNTLRIALGMYDDYLKGIVNNTHLDTEAILRRMNDIKNFGDTTFMTNKTLKGADK